MTTSVEIQVRRPAPMAVESPTQCTRCEGKCDLTDSRTLPLLRTETPSLDESRREDQQPANILLARQSGGEVVKVLDFGIATFVDAPVKNTSTTDTFLGTPAFIAPESLTGKAVDDRSDIYSVGVTLYSLLTGKLPHRADSESPLLQVLAQLHSPAVPIEKRRFDLPREVCKMIMAAISSEPQLRPSLQHIKDLLLGYTSGLADLSSPELSESGMFLPLAATLLNSDEEEDPAPSSVSTGKPRR